MSPIQPGDLVVCVDARPDANEPKAHLLVARKTYRVGTVGLNKRGIFSLAFDCIPSRPGYGWAFRADRFRPLTGASDTFTAQMRAMRPARGTVGA